MIDQRSLELTASSSEDTTIVRSDSNNGSSADSVENCPIDVDINSEKFDSDDDDDVDIVTQVNTSTTNKNGCIECNLPSDHSCRKCKKCGVFSLCCAEKRELENAWWCDICFKKQNVASQQLIRDGLYHSNNKED